MNDSVMYFQLGPEYTWRVTVPENKVHELFKHVHESLGRIGQNRLDQIPRQFYWRPHQRRDVRNICLVCTLYAEINGPRQQN